MGWKLALMVATILVATAGTVVVMVARYLHEEEARFPRDYRLDPKQLPASLTIATHETAASLGLTEPEMDLPAAFVRDYWPDISIYPDRVHVQVLQSREFQDGFIAVFAMRFGGEDGAATVYHRFVRVLQDGCHRAYPLQNGRDLVLVERSIVELKPLQHEVVDLLLRPRWSDDCRDLLRGAFPGVGIGDVGQQLTQDTNDGLASVIRFGGSDVDLREYFFDVLQNDNPATFGWSRIPSCDQPDGGPGARWMDGDVLYVCEAGVNWSLGDKLTLVVKTRDGLEIRRLDTRIE